MSDGSSSVRWLRETAIIFLSALVISILVRMFALDVFVVPTASMSPTIMPSDRLFGEKISYIFNSPKPGDVVTFINPDYENKTKKVTYVKRVIATANDVVDLRDGDVYVNDIKLNEPYTHGAPSYPLSSQAKGVEISYPYTVPEGHIWVMGDNRTNSSDSRYFGPVPLENVTSHGILVFWPTEHAKSI